jgi:hypothetical protein
MRKSNSVSCNSFIGPLHEEEVVLLAENALLILYHSSHHTRGSFDGISTLVGARQYESYSQSAIKRPTAMGAIDTRDNGQRSTRQRTRMRLILDSP